MTTEAAPDEKAVLRDALGLLRKFAQFDPKMQISTVMTLLEVAYAEAQDEPITPLDIEKRVGIMSGAASRNVYYWAEGHKDMRGGHNMLSVKIDPMDRRRRVIRTTPKGRAFIDQLMEGVRVNGKAARN